MVLTLKFTLRMTYQWKLSPYLGWASQHHGTKKQNDHKMSPIYGRIYYHVEGLWNGISHAISIKKECNSHQWFGGLQIWMRTLKKEHSLFDPADVAIPSLPPPTTVTAMELGGGGEVMWEIKMTKCWSQIAEMHMKEMVSIIPESCIFP